MVDIQILRPDNGVGLTRDGVVVKNILEEIGYNVFMTDSHADVLEYRNRRFDMNIFLEVVNAKYLRQSATNILVPNPEWFPEKWVSYRRRFNMVLCKTQHAVEIFKSRGFKTTFTGFTSDNRYDGTKFEDKEFVFLHAPGRSRLKSTEQVIKAWKDNPHFPTLYLITSYEDLSDIVAGVKNIKYTYGRVKEKTFLEIQNRAMVHVMPSVSEGFGHSIVEPMSTGAIIITTDGVPMNELVGNFGYLCKASPAGHFNLGPIYKVKPEAIAEQVEAVLATDKKLLKHKGKLARLTWAENHLRFNNLFTEAIRKIPI